MGKKRVCTVSFITRASATTRDDLGKELCCQFAGFALFMPCARLDDEFPGGASLPIDREDTLNTLDAERLIFASHKEDARHGPRGGGRKVGEVVAAFVDDKGRHARRFPAGELVIELAARGEAPEQERRGGRFGMRCRLREAVHRIEQRSAAAIVSAGIVLDIHVLVWMVREPATDKREAVPPGKVLPEQILDLRPSVAVAAGNEHRYAEQRPGFRWVPPAEGRDGEVWAGRNLNVKSGSGAGETGRGDKPTQHGEHASKG